MKSKEHIPLFDLRKIIEVKNLDSISVLKIDVEGAELEVLNRFNSLIKEQHPIILIEILPSYNDENTFRIERQDKIQAMLKDAGYSMFRVIKDTDVLLDLKEIQDINIHSYMNNCEYVMVPGTKKNKFEYSCQQRLKRQ
ncbi:MAG: FkbM family methyltransferase [Saprospiraceae bacterium]